MKELNVKVGDEVCYIPSSVFPTKLIAKVTKVTPTGRISIDLSYSQFDKFGCQIGRDSYHISQIYELTSDEKRGILEKNFIRRCINEFHAKKETITYDQAVKIMKILNEGEQNEMAD